MNLYSLKGFMLKSPLISRRKLVALLLALTKRGSSNPGTAFISDRGKIRQTDFCPILPVISFSFLHVINGIIHKHQPCGVDKIVRRRFFLMVNAKPFFFVRRISDYFLIDPLLWIKIKLNTEIVILRYGIF